MTAFSDNSSAIMYEAEVVSVDDEYDGRRIKARLSSDKGSIDEIPYAFPLLPKMFNIVPKVGELVLLICTRTDTNSNRFYIGPIVSQYQNMEKDTYLSGLGQAPALFGDRTTDSAQEAISHYEVTDGAFPPGDKTAVIGRETEDISLRDGDIQLRAGARVDVSDEHDALQGKVGFDNKDMGYILMRKDDNGIGVHCDKDSNVSKTVTVIGSDKVYFASRHNNDVDSALNDYDADKIIPTEKMQQLQDALHAVPYGDVLVECLNTLKDAIVNHVHPWPGLPPCKANGVDTVISEDYNKILSPNMYIS